MKYQILQIQLDAELVAAVNSDSTTAYQQEKWIAYLDCTTDASYEKALNLGMFSHVADIEAKHIDQVFEIGNIGPEHLVTRYKPMHSVSVGNLVVDADGRMFVCAPVGWDELSPQAVSQVLKALG